MTIYMQRVFALLVILHCAVISAQESQYEQMKQLLNDHSLPLVNLTVDMGAVNRSHFVSGEMEIADYLRRTEPHTDTVRYHCAFRIRGASASKFAKKSFAIKLYDEQGEDLDASLFGIRKENSWILDAMAIDRTRMRNRICFDVWNAFSHTPYETKYGNRNGTKGEFVEVFINGVYNGLYCLTDKIDRKLLGLKKAIANDDAGVEVRGILYKGINWGSGSTLLSYQDADTGKSTWNAWELQYPDEYPSADTWQPLMDLIHFCSISTADKTFVQMFPHYFYTGNLVDYALFTMALNVGDNAYKNTFLSVVDITQGHRYLLSPWDMDMSLGGNWDGAYNDVLASINRYDRVAPFYRLAEQNIDGFNDLLADKWAECCMTIFSCERMADQLDQYAEQFTASGAWEREYAKWNGNPVPLKEHIEDELEYVKEWYARNHAHLCNQFGIMASVCSPEKTTHRPFSSIHSVDGRAFNAYSLHRGLYIINGKKVLIR